MSEDILFELYVFCKSLLLGVSLTVVYDVVRITRRIIKRSVVIVAIEDIVLSVVAAFIIFAMVYKEINGNLRGYIFTGIVIGMGLYLVSVSKIFVGITSKCILMVLQKIINKYKINKKKLILKVRRYREKDNCKENKTIK